MFDTSRLSALDGTFDVLIIGGGIIGAGIARDAALRGYRVVLLEKADYGGGTTSGSTRLIHGGLRYLEMFDFGLVRMDLRERETLMRIARRRVRPLRFLLPFYKEGLFGRLRIRAGMILYDALSYDRSLPGHKMLSPDEAMLLEPALEPRGLRGAASFSDAQVDAPERLTADNILDARRHGAACLNYVEVTGAVHEDDKLAGVTARDAVTGETMEVRARAVVNASGPWFDKVARCIENRTGSTRIRTTKGIHLACDRVVKQAHALISPIDGRLFFVIPWLGYSWVGTTDTDFEGDPADAAATPDDVQYLIESASAYFPALKMARIHWTNAGVRALVLQDGRASESEVSRAHRIDTSPGLVSVLGGKITGYRAIAEEAVDALEEELGTRGPCLTAKQPLPDPVYEAPEEELEAIYPPDEGVRAIVAEEQCVHLTDFLFRRTTLGFAPDQGRAIAPKVLRLMAETLHWDSVRSQQEMSLLGAHYNRTEARISSPK